MFTTQNEFMNPSIEIAVRVIGADHPPLVIAEIGINHEGSLDVAKQLVDAAHRPGLNLHLASILK